MKKTRPILRAFWADCRAAAAAVFLGVEILVVLLLPLFLGQDPNLTDREAGFWAPPSSQHLLGTDDVDLPAGGVCLRCPGGGAGGPLGPFGGV